VFTRLTRQLASTPDSIAACVRAGSGKASERPLNPFPNNFVFADNPQVNETNRPECQGCV